MSRRDSSAHRYPRTARLNELVREIVAEEIERVDDGRLTDLAITSVEVEADLRRGVVWIDTLEPEADDEILEALEEYRHRFQKAIGTQTRVKRTPVLEFRIDGAIRTGERIDAILRENPPIGRDDDGEPGMTPEPGGGET